MKSGKVCRRRPLCRFEHEDRISRTIPHAAAARCAAALRCLAGACSPPRSPPRSPLLRCLCAGVPASAGRGRRGASRRSSDHHRARPADPARGELRLPPEAHFRRPRATRRNCRNDSNPPPIPPRGRARPTDGPLELAEPRTNRSRSLGLEGLLIHPCPLRGLGDRRGTAVPRVLGKGRGYGGHGRPDEICGGTGALRACHVTG